MKDKFYIKFLEACTALFLAENIIIFLILQLR